MSIMYDVRINSRNAKSVVAGIGALVGNLRGGWDKSQGGVVVAETRCFDVPGGVMWNLPVIEEEGIDLYVLPDTSEVDGKKEKVNLKAAAIDAGIRAVLDRMAEAAGLIEGAYALGAGFRRVYAAGMLDACGVHVTPDVIVVSDKEEMARIHLTENAHRGSAKPLTKEELFKAVLPWLRRGATRRELAELGVRDGTAQMLGLFLKSAMTWGRTDVVDAVISGEAKIPQEFGKYETAKQALLVNPFEKKGEEKEKATSMITRKQWESIRDANLNGSKIRLLAEAVLVGDTAAVAMLMSEAVSGASGASGASAASGAKE